MKIHTYIFFSLFLLLFSDLAKANEYTRDEARSLINNSRQHILNYCENVNLNANLCFRATQSKFQKTISKNYNTHPNYKFLRDCQNSFLLNNQNYQFNKFFECFDNYMYRNNLNTIHPEYNYLFILPQYTRELGSNFCSNFSNNLNVYESNRCVERQSHDSNIFITLWFASSSNNQFRKAIENCFENYKIINNNNLIIDFSGLINCIQN